MSRAVIVVLDGVGVGELPDAEAYGDAGSNTLGNLARVVGGLHLPNLQRFGLGNITPIAGVPPCRDPLGAYGRMAERSAGKDSTTGHWELAGVVTAEPFPLFPRGFPPELIARVEELLGRRTIGNCTASGTEIIERLGEKHLTSGCPIVYTSADSVLQVACHESVLPAAELHRACARIREVLQGPWRVGRVIARPFAGEPGSFRRTSARRDFSCPPPQGTLLDNCIAAGLEVTGIGKVDDLFARRGFTRMRHSIDNRECIGFILETLAAQPGGLVFANLVQFDMEWGHRNDCRGFARGLADFDSRLPVLLDSLGPLDWLFLTADHGNDPTTSSTDHSREHVPLLACGPQCRPGTNLGRRSSFADLGQTCAAILGTQPTPDGRSFLPEISIGGDSEQEPA
ncbi:MAG: phosphopentomutase [bacterium]